MAREAEEEEREFLAGLKARTGRDLAEWMAAIAAQGFADKNEVIDWLREQGLPFARASWLERIHKNGGKPIYASNLQKPAREASEPPKPVGEAGEPPKPASDEPPRPDSQWTIYVVPTPRQVADFERLLAAAKGYRPLYDWLADEISKALPPVSFVAKNTYVSIGGPKEFAAVTFHKTGLRLGLDLGDRPFDAQLQRSNMRGPGPAITHMIVLDDARQINDELMSLLKAAQLHANAQNLGSSHKKP